DGDRGGGLRGPPHARVLRRTGRALPGGARRVPRTDGTGRVVLPEPGAAPHHARDARDHPPPAATPPDERRLALPRIADPPAPRLAARTVRPPAPQARPLTGRRRAA